MTLSKAACGYFLHGIMGMVSFLGYNPSLVMLNLVYKNMECEARHQLGSSDVKLSIPHKKQSTALALEPIPVGAKVRKN